MTLAPKKLLLTLGLIAVSVWSGVTFAAQILIVPPPPAPVINPALPYALQWLEAKTPTNLVNVCWLNLVKHTNTSANIYTTYNFPTNVVRNTNCIIFNATGSTAIVQNFGAGDGVPAVLLTKRCVYIRGHDTGTTDMGVVTNGAGQVFYFYDRTNGIHTAIAGPRIGRLNTGGDYTLISLTNDVTGIDVMPQAYAADVTAKFSSSITAVSPYCPILYASIYPPSISFSPTLSGFWGDVGGYMGSGTSGSPNMILLPTATGETLAMFAGRTTSGLSALMLADLAALNTACGLSNSDPNYQPVIVDLSNWPNL